MGFFMSIRVRALANSVTTAVNENYNAVIKVSEGYTITPDGDQVPKYSEIPKVLQLQSMSSDDLQHFGYANMQGLFMFAYADGMIEALNREDQKGESTIETIKYGETDTHLWKVMRVAESYNDWVKIIIRYVGRKNGNP